MQRSQYQQVPLLPLGPEAITELLTELLGSDETLEGLPELIRDRTGGNPFFIEEVVQSLVESGHLEGERGAYRLTTLVEEIGVPTSVRAILAARIDRLAEREKRVFQTAAVIGKTFEEPILEQVCDLPKPELTSALHALKTAEFIYEQSLYPVAEYAFKHPLTQAVGLESQLRDRRSRLHADVARVLEEHHAEKLDEHSALLAYHWEEAGENLGAARWHKRAAEWAGLSHGSEAVRHWMRVRDLLRSGPESDEAIELQVEAIGQILTMGLRTGQLEDAEEIVSEGRELVRRSRNPRSRAHFLRSYGAFLIFSGQPDVARKVLREAVQVADETGDDVLRAGARTYMSLTYFSSGALRDGIAMIDESLKLVRTHRTSCSYYLGYDALSSLTGWRGMLLAEAGRLVEGARDVARAVQLAREVDDTAASLLSQFVSGWVAHAIGDAPTAFTHAQRAVELGEQLGVPNFAGLGYNMLGRALFLDHRWGEAVDAFESALERSLQIQRTILLPHLALAWIGRGDAVRGLSIAEEAVSQTREQGATHFEVEAHIALARALLAVDGVGAQDRAESALARAEELVEETGARRWTPNVHLARAELAGLHGQNEVRESHLRDAHRLFTEMGATGHAERLAREIDS